MSVSANEYVGVPVVDERLGSQIVLWLARIIGPVTATAKPDVGHENSQSLTLKALVRRIILPDIQSIAVAVHAGQRFERRDLLGALKGSEVPGVPDLVHRLQELSHILGKHAVSVGNQADEHIPTTT